MGYQLIGDRPKNTLLFLLYWGFLFNSQFIRFVLRISPFHSILIK